MALIVDKDSADQRLRGDAPLKSAPPAVVMRTSRKITVGNDALCEAIFWYVEGGRVMSYEGHWSNTSLLPDSRRLENYL